MSTNSSLESRKLRCCYNIFSDSVEGGGDVGSNVMSTFEEKRCQIQTPMMISAKAISCGDASYWESD